MNNRSGFLLKNMGILTLANFSSKLLSFLLVPLYTGVLSTEEYGIYDLVVSTVSLAYPILTLNIVDSVMRFCMDKSYEKMAVVTIGTKFISRSFLIAGAAVLLLHLVELPLAVDNLEWYILIYFDKFN